MGQISKGETFADTAPNNAVTSTRLNNLVDGGTLLPGAVTDQTALGTAIAATDDFLVHDASAVALKKVQAQNLLVPEIITGKTDISTSIAAGDLLLMSDISASNALMKVQAQNLLTPEAITNKTALTTGLATDDVLLLNDTSASALKQITIANVIALLPPLLTNKSTPTTSDKIFIGDAAASDAGKYSTVTQLATAIASANSFTSSTLAMTSVSAAGSYISAAHGLSATPKEVFLVLVCTTTDLGYAVGDEVRTGYPDTAAVSVFANATTVGFTTNSAVGSWRIPHKSTGTVTAITSGSWSAKIYARL